MLLFTTLGFVLWVLFVGELMVIALVEVCLAVLRLCLF